MKYILTILCLFILQHTYVQTDTVIRLAPFWDIDIPHKIVPEKIQENKTYRTSYAFIQLSIHPFMY